MISFFLNPWMLIGLAGVLLPVIAHLLSRKRYDIVDWGAMQFLELDPSAKRKYRLEELLLLALRMSLIALMALALARPWLNGSWFGSLAATQNRDIVLVVDGSYSMGWEGKGHTPHANANRLARQLVDRLHPGDSVMVLDAREQPRAALPGLTRDRQRVREALDGLPIPAGSSELSEALSRAMQILASGTSVQREIVVFTDRQALGWKPDETSRWERLDDQQRQSTIPPRIWVIDVADGDMSQATNFSVDRLQLSRELAVPGMPVRISSKVRYTGGDGPITRKVHLEINGQRLTDQTLQLKLQPDGEATVDFEHRFSKAGSQLITVALDDDVLPGDNRSHAVVVVTDSLPIVLVDGDPRLDKSRSETFFAQAALSAGEGDSAWIKTTVRTMAELDAESLQAAAIVVLANVDSVSPPQWEMLDRFVASGRGLLFTLGDKSTSTGFANEPAAVSAALFPVVLKEISSDADKDSPGVRVANNSLELPWLKPFRSEQGGTLTEARFTKWWSLAESPSRPQADSGSKPTVSKPAPGSEGKAHGADSTNAGSATPDTRKSLGVPMTIAKLTNGEPWIVTRRYGRGTAAVLLSSLDADWNTLPAKQDYVPWLHELLFALSNPSTSRNGNVGTPLSLTVPQEWRESDFEFLSPDKQHHAPERLDDAFEPQARLNSVSLPGLYRFVAKAHAGKPHPSDELFVANFDRQESDLTPLTEPRRNALSHQGRMTFVPDLDALQSKMNATSTRTEFWPLLIYGFLAFLILEVWMTRRMVHQGEISGTPVQAG